MTSFFITSTKCFDKTCTDMKIPPLSGEVSTHGMSAIKAHLPTHYMRKKLLKGLERPEWYDAKSLWKSQHNQIAQLIRRLAFDD